MKLSASEGGNLNLQVQASELLFSVAETHLRASRYSDAALLYEELANRGFASAQVYLGWVYSEGKGVPLDKDRALHWFKAAADQGSGEGMFYCGRLLDDLDRVEDAFSYFQSGAAKNYGPALCRMGIAYITGRGVTVNQAYASQYLRKAAELGNIFARRELAVLKLRNAHTIRQKFVGASQFLVAVVSSFFVALRDPNSDKIKV